jgi:hypothetical protein
MVVHADLPPFVENVEAAFQVERRACAAGWRCPNWSEPIPFAEARQAYLRLSGVGIPAQPWDLAGWLAAQGGWLADNATHRADTALGAAEVEATLARLRRVAAKPDALLTVMRHDRPFRVLSGR